MSNLNDIGSIPDALMQAAKQRTEDILKRMTNAMALMDKEIIANDGVYPLNRGRITQSEVCRRAGVSKVTLQGRAHKTTTKLIVDAWVAGHLIRLVPDVRKAVTERVDLWKSEHSKIATEYAIAMLDLVEAHERIKVLERQNADMHERLNGVSNGKIVQLVQP